ncbi:hypothetical protein HKX48_005552 [Thoreauomyces humboldtii]|nr:hypothetical protein HKX48_005552 [Thoreauomyces humboldtii]
MAGAAASTPHASTPASGTGTPLMNLATYLLWAECAAILALSVPVYVPYRRQVMEWIQHSPRLWTLRVIVVCVHAFVAILLGDTYLRLNRTTLQIQSIQAAQAQNLAGAAGGVPGQIGAQGGFTAPTDATGPLYSARFRAQRDLQILGFTLFCSVVLGQLYLLICKMDRFRNERDELRARLNPESVETPSAGIAASIRNATHAVTDKVDALLHHNAPLVEHQVPAVSTNARATLVTPVVAPAESDNVVQQRVVYAQQE